MSDRKRREVGPQVLDTAEVSVDVLLGSSVLQVGQLGRLEDGTILELDTLVGEPLAVKVGNTVIARGEAVVIDDRLGVRLTEVTRGLDSDGGAP